MGKNDRLKEAFEFLRSNGKVHTQKDLAIQMGATSPNVSGAFKGDPKILTDKFIKRFNNAFGDIFNLDWLLDGEGSMLNNTNSEVSSIKESNMIPFFDDVYSVGGDNDIRANVDDNGYNVEMVNTGDWFKSATAAIRHIGDSMVEYPAGSILAVRRVDDINLLVNGKAYVIETTEYRVTKLIRDEGEYLMAYSTNTATHPDGSLIYAPMRIPKNSIRRIDIVLGCVNIEQGTLIELNTK